MKSALRRYWQLGLMMLCVALAYGSALNGPLLFGDYSELLQQQRLYIDGGLFDSWRVAALSPLAGDVHQPLTLLSFAANYVLFGGYSPITVKAVNLLIHLVTAVVIYRFALAVFRALVVKQNTASGLRLTAMAAVALWVLHPLHVSTVLYSAQRGLQLSNLFILLGLCVFVHYRLRWAECGAAKGGLVAAGLWLALSGFGAVCSGGYGLYLLMLSLVVEVTLFRGQWRGLENTRLQGLAWIALGLLLLIVVVAPTIDPLSMQLGEVSLDQQLMTQSRVLWHDLGWLFIPDITSMGFQHDHIARSQGLLQPLTTLTSLLAWLAVLAGAFAIRQRFPLLLFALLFFLVVQLLEPHQTVAMLYEQGNYLASVGLCLLLAQILTTPAIWNRTVGLWAPLGTVLGVLMLLLFFRTQLWSDQMSLAQANVVNHPASARARYFYADALLTNYRRRQTLGEDMNSDAARGLVVASREQFLQAQAGAPEDIPTLLMLAYVDSLFFPGMPQQTDWISMASTAGRGAAIEARDLSALSLLLGCAGSERCDVSHAALEALLDTLIARNPGNHRLPILKYETLVALGTTPERRLAVLEQASSIFYNPYAERYKVLEFGRRNDVAGMYEVVGPWLANDPGREDLLIIKSLFDVPADAAEPERTSVR